MSINFGNGRMNRENGVAFFGKEDDGLVAVAFRFVAGSEDGDVHGQLL